MSLRELLGKQLIFADGGMGTELQSAGLGAGESPVLWNVTHPDEIKRIHSAYLDAGATFVTSNTFGANALKLAGTAYGVEEIVSAGVSLARAAVDQQERACFVALDIGPLGGFLKPFGDISFDDAVELFKEQVVAGVAAGADFVIIETMIEMRELKAAILAAKEASDVPIVASVALNEQGRMLSGAAVPCVCALLEGLSVDALGFNCGAGPREIASFVRELSALASTPLLFSPNAGLPEVVDGQAVYNTTPSEFADYMKPLVEDCVAIAGGCCGTTPAHIAALVAACKDVVLKPASPPKTRFISSYAVALDLDSKEFQIDRRIDATTNEALAEALVAGNYERAIDEVFNALDEGAEIIGLNAIHPDLDELEVLPALVDAIQGATRTPLLIESARVEALKSALRVYAGCALVDLKCIAPDKKEAARSIVSYYGGQQLG